MKKLKALIVATTVMLFAFPVVTSAQAGMKWMGSGGWGMGSQYNRLYDGQTVETLTGEVTRVDEITPLKGMSYGLHLMVKTDKETISTHLGPGWFLENQDIKFEVGDKVEVKGSRINFEGKPAIIAVHIKKGDKVLILRDEAGFPAWAGLRGR